MKRWLIPVFGTSGLALVVWLLSTGLDIRSANPKDSALGVLLLSNPNTSRYVLTGIAQSLAAVLGITMMVVLLVVQLAAARYSHSLIQLYIEDWVNTLLLSGFVFSIVYSLWVANTIKEDFVPSIGTLASLVFATACFVSLIPYFRHVFGFLEPEIMVTRLENRATRSMQTGAGAGESEDRIIHRMGQLGRIATTSVAQMETDVAVSAIAALERICCRHLQVRAEGAESHVHPVELEALQLLNRIYGLALNRARDVTYAVAGSGRVIAESALSLGRGKVPRASLMLLNTMLRSGINEKDSLTIYHLLHQYRMLAESLLDHGDDRVLDVLFYFKYYALLAQQTGVKFIVDTVAYDLNILCQKAQEDNSPLMQRVLDSFLDMELFLEKSGQAAMVFPIRKMYGVLAGHFLAKGAPELAGPLIDRLRCAPAGEKTRLKEELLLGPTHPYFWEFTERKVNFDYLGKRERESLRPYLDGLTADGPDD